jgi:polyvinyl alcohol dehydrogenase (cytochrome)
MRWFLLSLCALSLVAADCPADSKGFKPGSGDWNGWSPELTNSRFQPQPKLAAADVPKLKVKWAFGFEGDLRAVGQVTVVGGRVFTGSQGGKIYSLDAATGCTYWMYDAGGIVRSSLRVEKNDNQWVVFFGDGSGWAHAVDATTGKLLWKVRVDEHPLARLTGGVTFYKGRLYIGVASGEELGSNQPKYECCTFRGSLVALDAKTGKTVWKTFTIPDPPKPLKTTAEGLKISGPAGVGIWSAPTIDEKRRRIYAATGNSFSSIDVPTSDSILAFDMDSGSLLWSSQPVPGDNWIPGCPKNPACPEKPGDDFDFGSSASLRDLPGGRQVLVATQKSGVIWGLDPENRGKVLWQTRVGKGGPVFGGIEWGSAYEGINMYAAVGDNGPGGTPGMYALRVDTGAQLWNVPATDASRKSLSAAVTAIPGVAFATSLSGHVRAYAAKTGEVIWDYDALHDFDTVNGVKAKGGSFNGAGPAVSNGMVFVSSGFGFAGGLPGNVLLAFSVDGK